MNIAGIDTCEMCNGTGVGVSIYISGCNRRCENCHNPQAWDFNYGIPVADCIEDIQQAINKPYIDRLSILGGEPLESLSEVCDLLKKINPRIDVWLYTGYSLGDISDEQIELINQYFNYIVDGEYIKELKTTVSGFFGSSNQRIYKRINNKWQDITHTY